MPLPTCSPVRPLPSPGSWNLLPARGRGPCEELLRLWLFPSLFPFSSPKKHTGPWSLLSGGSSWGSGVLLSGKNTSHSFNYCRRCAFPCAAGLRHLEGSVLNGILCHLRSLGPMGPPSWGSPRLGSFPFVGLTGAVPLSLMRDDLCLSLPGPPLPSQHLSGR